MRLIRGNVERVTEDKEKAEKLKADGYKELVEKTTVSAEETREEGNLPGLSVAELKALAKSKGLEGYSGLSKEELLSVLKDVV